MPSRNLLHIPHASRSIPEDLRHLFVLDDGELSREIVKMTDLYTDELFELAEAERLVAGFSRLVVDVERFEDDDHEVMARRGMGAVYTRTHDGRELKRAPDRAGLMERFYYPHHSQLTAACEQALLEHDSCLIIDCHSFPSKPLNCDLDQKLERPDICLGTAGIHTHPTLLRTAIEAFEHEGLSVSVDSPYAGSIVPQRWHQTDARVQSLMIEVRRDLFTIEATGEKSDRFSAVKQMVSECLETIAAQDG